MRTIKLVRPKDLINSNITCQDCKKPMPVEKDAAILDIDWDLITLPVGWTEKYTKATTALGEKGVKRVETKVYYCQTCWTHYIRDSLPPLPEPTLEKVEAAFRDTSNPKNDSEPPPPSSGERHGTA